MPGSANQRAMLIIFLQFTDLKPQNYLHTIRPLSLNDLKKTWICRQTFPVLLRWRMCAFHLCCQSEYGMRFRGTEKSLDIDSGTCLYFSIVEFLIIITLTSTFSFFTRPSTSVTPFLNYIKMNLRQLCWVGSIHI